MYAKVRKRGNSRKIAFAIAALIAWASVPFFFGVKAGDEIPMFARTANLVSPTGTVNPHGHAEWELYQSGHRELEVEIEDVNLPAGTALSAVIDGNVVGQVILEADRRGRLKLRTQDGQTVPTVNDGSTAEVRNGSIVLVRGVFGGGPAPTPSGTPPGTPSPSPSPTGTPTGTPSPSPSPTGTPSPSPSPNGDLFASLTGPVLNGVLPNGFAQFEIHSSRVELEVRVRNVNLPIGTSLGVVVDNVAAGNLTLTSAGEGELRLRSDNGQTVPAVVPGSKITIRNGSDAVLSGIFAGMTGPAPSPSPSPSPGPTASPTPSQGRSFEAHLLGSRATPPVNTNANGEIKIVLNAAEDQATVFGEFHNLSSNQTGARIETTTGTTTTVFDLGVVGGQNGRFATATFAITAAQVQQLRTGLLSSVITSANNTGGEIRGTLLQHSGESDFDGDGSNDLAVFRPSAGAWYSLNSTGFNASTFGSAADQVVSGDYDGDGKTDAAVFRISGGSGFWNIRRSSDNGLTTSQFGAVGDIPARGDFDGDGRFDLAVYRPSNGMWYVQKSDNTGYMFVPFGIAEDKPMPADMDGDGRDDIAVFRPSEGNWYWLRSSDGQFAAVHFGFSGDIPVRGDFDGDGKNDLTVYRPSTGVWYILRTSDGGFSAVPFGVSEDIPVAGQYDGDGIADIAVFRPSTGIWYILRSSDMGFAAHHFGLSGDVPVVAR